MKKSIAIKYLYDVNPFYIHFKKHLCPNCAHKLELVHNSKVVNSDSPEAKYYDFSVGDTYIKGNIEFRTLYFHCSICHLNFALKEIRSFEKQRNKKI